MKDPTNGSPPDDLATLFERLIRLPPAERPALLDEIARQNRELRDRLSDLVEAAGEPWPESLGEMIGDPGALMPEEGSRIGDYRIEAWVDLGGFGEVYRASRADGLFEREVAIKILNGIEGDGELDQFRSEARILASLNHPNVAQLLDANITSRGRPYIILEYIQGRSIDRFCAEQGMELRQRVHLFLALCEAVDFAHRNLIVHGDLTPSNVLVDSEGRVKLLDFGISRLTGTECRGRRLRVGGTPGFAAPEQLAGEPLTTASDVYSLGKLLDHLLSAPAPPGAGDQSSNGDQKDPPDAGATPNRATGRPRRPADLDAIIAKATRADQKDRYGSVRALAEDLERLLACRPVTARRLGILRKTAKFLWRNRFSSAAVGLLSLSLVVGTVVSLWQAGAAREQRDLASAETEKTKHLYNLLLTLFDEANPQTRVGEVTVRQALEIGLRKAALELADQPLLHASLLTSIGRIYRSLGIYDRAGELLEQASGLHRQLGLQKGPEVADTTLEIANVEFYTGRFEPAEKHFREALGLRVETQGANSLEVAEARKGLAELLLSIGRFDESAENFQASLDIRLAQLGPHSLSVANSYAGLGKVYYSRGEFQKAEEFYLKAQAEFEASNTQSHATAGDNLNNLGLLMKRVGRYDEAQEFYARALEVLENAYGKDNVKTSACLQNIGQLYRARGDLKRAEEFVLRAVEIDRQGLGPDHPGLAIDLNNLGVILKARGKYDEAKRLYEESLAIRRKTLPENHPDIAQSINNLAALAYVRKDFDEALDLLRQALRIAQATQGPQHPQVATIVNNIGAVQEKRGDLKEARKAYEDALSILEPVTSPSEEKRLVAVDNLARILVRQGDFGRAKPLLESLVEGRLTLYGSDHEKTKEARKALRDCIRQIG